MREVVADPPGRRLVAPAGHRVGWARGRGGEAAQSYAPFRRVDPAVLAVALGLLRLDAVDRFVDLGCGDGAVVEAAGAEAGLVVGVELDPGLALRAHARLRAAAGSGRLVGRWRVLNEPIGWTAPSGMTAGFVNLLPFAGGALSAWLRDSAPPGFRAVVVGGWAEAAAGARRVAWVDAVEACGTRKPVELWKFGASGEGGA
ncbi:MAG: hypothetical protein OXG04_18685 [Acidobacteria bacterium]|nr:hypothetical protein [Acidobacteriota bacterium]